MKNSAETKAGSGDTDSGNPESGKPESGKPEPSKSESRKSGFSLFSIDEHRLSLGLLAMLLLVGAGYGIWLAMAPFLPASTAGKSRISRKELGESHAKAERWNEAIPIYREMLQDDPDNGFAIQRLARIREYQLFAKWRQLGRVGATTGNSNASIEILDEESQLFESATTRWRALRDNSRYQRRAYERLASLHSYRSQQIGAPEEVDIAIKILEEMVDKGLVTSNGIESTEPFRLLTDHPDFKRLVRDEKRNSNFRQPGVFLPYQPF